MYIENQFIGYQDPTSQLSLHRPTLHKPRPQDLHLLNRPIPSASPQQAHALHHAQARRDATEDGVLPIQPRRGRQRDEELAAVGVLSRVGHAQDAGARVPQVGGDLVGELVAVDGE